MPDRSSLILKYCSLRSNRRSRAATWRASAHGWLVLTTIVLLTVGCKTADYSAAKLPESLRVPPMPTSNGINLTQMSGGGMNTSQLAPGDLVEITIVSGHGDEEVRPSPARVSNDGTVAVPVVGAVAVGGLEPFAAEQQIAAAAVERNIYRHPYVTLSVTQRAMNRVTVMGAVVKPGVVELPRGSSDLISALAAAGGMKEEASLQIDVLRHSGSALAASRVQKANSSEAPGQRGIQLASYSSPVAPQIAPPRMLPTPEATRIDLAQSDRPTGIDFHLGDRDIVMVHPKEKRVIHVTGLVQKPDQYEMPYDKDVHVLDAIAMAGGIKSPLADKVFVIRQFPDMPEPAVIKLSIASAKRNGEVNLRLASGDLVSVEATPMTMMVDTATNFFRVAIGLSGSIVTF
jgi:polysaccharide export outer membrane protein